MKKSLCFKMFIAGCLLPFLVLTGACATQPVGTDPSSSTTPLVLETPTATPDHSFAATSSPGGQVDPKGPDASDNLTTINSPVDRPIAKFSTNTLNVPSKAKGAVYIQNNSDIPQTLVSDTPKGFQEFTIVPLHYSTLLFHRAGTFKAHIKGYPVSTETSLTIIITAPYPY